MPEIGDELTALVSLVSLDPLSGAFLNNPVSVANDQVFHWEVLHGPHDVTLRLAEITILVPEPTSLLLLAAGFVALRRTHDR